MHGSIGKLFHYLANPIVRSLILMTNKWTLSLYSYSNWNLYRHDVA